MLAGQEEADQAQESAQTPWILQGLCEAAQLGTQGQTRLEGVGCTLQSSEERVSRRISPERRLE